MKIRPMSNKAQPITRTPISFTCTPQPVEPVFQPRPFMLQAKETEPLALSGKAVSPTLVQDLGHSFGAISVQRSVPPIIQPKLTLGPVGDKYEQEADRVAQQVVHHLNTPSPEPGTSQAEPMPVQTSPVAQRLAAGEGGVSVSPGLETAIAQARGGGQPLPEQVRGPMERAFGADFSRVRVHTDSRADKLNRSIQARAFTTGRDIFVRQGEYQPGSISGRQLLAHELTHVVQQNFGSNDGVIIQRANYPHGIILYDEDAEGKNRDFAEAYRVNTQGKVWSFQKVQEEIPKEENFTTQIAVIAHSRNVAEKLLINEKDVYPGDLTYLLQKLNLKTPRIVLISCYTAAEMVGGIRRGGSLNSFAARILNQADIIGLKGILQVVAPSGRGIIKAESVKTSGEFGVSEGGYWYVFTEPETAGARLKEFPKPIVVPTDTPVGRLKSQYIKTSLSETVSLAPGDLPEGVRRTRPQPRQQLQSLQVVHQAMIRTQEGERSPSPTTRRFQRTPQ